MGYITKLPIALFCAYSLAGFSARTGTGNPDPGVQPVLVSATGTMSPGNYYTITVSVDQAGTSPTQVDLSSSDTSELTTPSSVTVETGQTQAQTQVYVPSGATAGSPTITATANGGEAQLSPTID